MNMVRNRSLLVISDILRLLLNILFANDKYSRHKRKNLTEVIQMEISKKSKIFRYVSKIYIKFKTFQNKADPHTLSISEFMDFESSDYLNV